MKTTKAYCGSRLGTSPERPLSRSSSRAERERVVGAPLEAGLGAMLDTSANAEVFSGIWVRLGLGTVGRERCFSFANELLGKVGSWQEVFGALGQGQAGISEPQFVRLVFGLALWSIKRLTPQPVSSPNGKLPLGRIAGAW